LSFVAARKTSSKNAAGSEEGVAPGKFEARRADLVASAAKLFAQRGYHATSMSDLTEAASLQRGGIYHYIDSKSDLLYMINENVIGPLAAEVREIGERDDPPEQALRALAHAFLGSIATHNEEVRVVLHEWKAIEERPDWEQIRAARRELEGVVEQVLQRGLDEGVFELPDVRLACLGFLNMVNHSYTWYDPAGRWPASRVADAFCDIFLGGIATKRPAKARARARARSAR
jgi:TetR/AcrR family transcriptional regulator, cholesterol catabolism regulator